MQASLLNHLTQLEATAELWEKNARALRKEASRLKLKLTGEVSTSPNSLTKEQKVNIISKRLSSIHKKTGDANLR